MRTAASSRCSRSSTCMASRTRISASRCGRWIEPFCYSNYSVVHHSHSITPFACRSAVLANITSQPPDSPLPETQAKGLKPPNRLEDKEEVGLDACGDVRGLHQQLRGKATRFLFPLALLSILY